MHTFVHFPLPILFFFSVLISFSFLFIFSVLFETYDLQMLVSNTIFKRS